MSRVPRIRFKGFEEDWEQRKLGEIVGIYDGVHQTPKYQDNGIMFLSVENIATLQSTKYISEDNFKRDYKVYPQENDILMTRIGDVGTTNVIADKCLKAYYVSLALLKYKSTNPYFLSNAIQSGYVKKELANRTLKTAIPMKINKDEIGKVDVMLPISVQEQNKIGEYFRNIDHLITLHQRKLEKLKIIKKSMLENLFPQNGEKTPKIRFSGFTKDWEQCKLGEIIQERNIRTSDFDRFPIFSLTIESGITPKTERYERSSLVTKTEDLFKVVKPNEFVTNPMNLRFGALGYNAQKYDVSVSGYYDVFSIDGNNCSGFWNAYFKTHHVMNIFDNVATGSLVEKKRVKYSTIKQIYLSVPTNIEEKNKISKFMILTNHLITLHQSKLDKLQKIKKSMLESMFV